MKARNEFVVTLLALLFATPAAAQLHASSSTPLAIGETFTIESRAVSETRRINVYLPPIYADSQALRLPVLYMPDGGIGEDFLHIAGLVQVSVGNGTMRPFILVGIENTVRRRDMTGPTRNSEDRKIAPVVGGSAPFRTFIRDELIPHIEKRYRTTDERAIMGESLAGLFVVETMFMEPDLFSTYIAFDPSIWWNDASIVVATPARAKRVPTLYLATSSEPEITRLGAQLADALRRNGRANVHYLPMPNETHATIYHPAALGAVRALFKPEG